MFTTRYFNPLYFTQPFFLGYPRVSEGKLSTDRTLPFDWFPRWFNGYYDETSPLRRFLYAAIHQSRMEFIRTLSSVDQPSFANNYGEDRFLFVLPVVNPVKYVPNLTLSTSIASCVNREIKYVSTIDSLLFEPIYPVWTYLNNSIVLRNLDVATYTVTSTGLRLDLSNAFFGDTPDEDTIIILENAYGDYYYYSIKDLNENAIPLNVDGTWLVHYRSGSLRNDLTQGNSHISIGTELINPKTMAWPNSWDSLGEIVGVGRLPNETNTAYMKRMFSYINVNSYNERIASMLNLSTAYVWDTGITLPLSGSGYTYASTPNLQKWEYLVDSVYVKSPTSFFINVDSPTISTLIIDNNVFSSNYIISGHNVLVSSNILANLTSDRIKFDYRKDIYDKQYGNTSYIQQIVPENLKRKSQTVILSQKIKCTPTEKRVNTYYWNRTTLTSNGAAEFS